MRARLYYEGNGVALYHGDWRGVWASLGLRAEEVALVWGDVPYQVREKTRRASRGGRTNAPHLARPTVGRNWKAVAGDDGTFDLGALLSTFGPVRQGKPPLLVLWGANNYAGRYGLPDSTSWLAWDKREGGTSDDNGDCELAWTNLGGPPRLFHHLWRGFIRRGHANGTARLHPTEKPVELSTWAFGLARLLPGQLVFSPTLGSGPEVRSALDMGLRLIGCEVEEEYLAHARARAEARTHPGTTLPRDSTQGTLPLLTKTP